jgi:hypothetical protein
MGNDKETHVKVDSAPQLSFHCMSFVTRMYKTSCFGLQTSKTLRDTVKCVWF